ncbi:MAG: transposase [Polyangiaceae bacterium]|nr:transposase [Polyangiaceae bacterium]
MTASGTAWTARSNERTSTRLAEKGAEANAIGRSRGGPTTKIHLVIDALGLPLFFEVTAGQKHDCQSAASLIEAAKPECLLADKAYDSNAIRQQLQEGGAVALIPPKANRTAAIFVVGRQDKNKIRSS